MFETNLTANKTKKLELINLSRQKIAYMGHRSGNKYIVYKFSLGTTFVFRIFDTKTLLNLWKILQKDKL